ncbi:hypothetical protein [Kitasatospora sp. NPDC047058]|uniref:hypothetical protein n=1 Tax=Kitasatospora sp. NPDC047058 TaxID=3155620 RepID=UPI0033C5F212
MSAKKFRLVSAVAAATVVLGAAAGLTAAGTGSSAPDRGTVTLADQGPATSTGSTTNTATDTANTTGTNDQHHNSHINDMGWQW